MARDFPGSFADYKLEVECFKRDTGGQGSELSAAGPALFGIVAFLLSIKRYPRKKQHRGSRRIVETKPCIFSSISQRLCRLRDTQSKTKRSGLRTVYLVGCFRVKLSLVMFCSYGVVVAAAAALVVVVSFGPKVVLSECCTNPSQNE